MGVKSFDHVGVVVDDLEAATTFFLDLGLEREGGGSIEGEWMDKVVGLDDVRAELVVVRTPDAAASSNSPSTTDRPTRRVHTLR